MLLIAVLNELIERVPFFNRLTSGFGSGSPCYSLYLPIEVLPNKLKTYENSPKLPVVHVQFLRRPRSFLRLGARPY
jgi:hypothetical protein